MKPKTRNTMPLWPMVSFSFPFSALFSLKAIQYLWNLSACIFDHDFFLFFRTDHRIIILVSHNYSHQKKLLETANITMQMTLSPTICYSLTSKKEKTGNRIGFKWNTAKMTLNGTQFRTTSKIKMGRKT